MLRAMVSALAAVAFAAPAMAHERRGHDDDHRAQSEHGSHATISHERVLEIAREQGVETVREIDIEDGRWKVEGWTREGREIEVEIDTHSGAVLKREIE